MREILTLHPQSACTAVASIEAEVVRKRPAGLALTYIVTGAMSELYLPAMAAPGRKDELWRRTCFEVFVGRVSGIAYYEFNFAPSTQWAVYDFDGYRTGMSVPNEMATPRIEVFASDAHCELQVMLDLDQAPRLPRDAAWRVALSAVIEETNGRRSYWALAHPSGKPDFHHSDGFVCVLPPEQTS